MRDARRILTAILLTCLGATSQAATYSVLVESDPGGLGNFNYGEFASLGDLKTWNVASSHGIGQNLFGSGVSARGYTYDGSQYHVFVESDPGGLGNINLGSFDTLIDLKNWNVSSSAYLGQNIWGSGVSIGGMAFDGTKYHVFLESDPGGLGNVNLATFDSLNDLKAWNFSSSAYLGQNPWGTSLSLRGFDYDGSQFHALLESDPGGVGALFLTSFASLADVKNWSPESSTFIGTNLFGSGVSVAGLTAVADQTVAEVPVPATFGLLGGTLTVLVMLSFSWRSRQRRRLWQA